MKYLKTFESYYKDALRYYVKSEDDNNEDEILDEDEVEVDADDVIKPLKKDENDCINKLNNLL